MEFFVSWIQGCHWHGARSFFLQQAGPGPFLPFSDLLVDPHIVELYGCCCRSQRRFSFCCGERYNEPLDVPNRSRHFRGNVSFQNIQISALENSTIARTGDSFPTGRTSGGSLKSMRWHFKAKPFAVETFSLIIFIHSAMSIKCLH